MKSGYILLFLFAGILFVRAQEQTVTLSEIVEGAQQWAEENLDTNVLNALPELDEKQVQEFFRIIQQRYQGEYIVDMAQVKGLAISILPLLEAHPETQPYVAWLKVQLDYLDVAEEYSATNPPPKVEPGKPPVPVPNPTPQYEREIWVTKMAARPWPAAARPYVPRMKALFLAQNVPAEFVWVAEVESGFDRRAYSPAGAAGLFQLMPDTAKRFGLSLWPRDQRYQLEPSATASAQYLKFLYGKFKDWRLALAAYNAGEGTVQRLLERYRTKDFDRIATHLPAQTQMYVPKVEATILRREGMSLAKIKIPRPDLKSGK